MAGQNSFSLFILLTSLWALLSSAADVFRADSRAPSAIKDTGFLAKGLTTAGTVAPDISLWNHVNGAASGFSRSDDGYVSTTTDEALATSWVSSMLRGSGYVYRIHVAPNMIDCQATLKQYNPYPQEKEYAALGGIKYQQIVGWTKITSGVKGKEEKNPSYNKSQFKRSTSSGPQYQLAAFPAGHPAWALSPWKDYATCSNPKIRAARAVLGRATCRPKQTNAQAAQDYVAKMYS